MSNYSGTYTRILKRAHAPCLATGRWLDHALTCDFCEQVFGHLALWPKEEHAYPTQQEYTDQSARVGIRSAPHAYDTRRRVAACSR